ncbi:MAG: hypothetical protein ABJR05_02990 [Balneola sp.]
MIGSEYFTKYKTRIIFPLFFPVLIILLGCTEPKKKFYVHNKDAETIDSLQIYVGDEIYLIESLQPRETKGLKIYKMGGKKVSFQADTGRVMTTTSVLTPPFRGTIKFIITKERIISVGFSIRKSSLVSTVATSGRL